MAYFLTFIFYFLFTDNENEFSALFQDILNLNCGDSTPSDSKNDVISLLDRNEISKQLKLRIPLMKNVSNVCIILWIMGSTKLTIKGNNSHPLIRYICFTHST